MRARAHQGGGIATVGCLAALAGMWCLPQAFIVAELGAAMPSNAGYVDWVLHALGPTAGYVAAMNGMAQVRYTCRGGGREGADGRANKKKREGSGVGISVGVGGGGGK